MIDDADRIPCPRCSHDLRGDQLAWRTACPLEGRCPECGLDFAWGDILSGRLHEPRWSTEGARSVGDWFVRAPRQLIVATLLPRRMMRQLRLEHRIRPLRLVAGLAPPLAMLLVVLGLMSAGELARYSGTSWGRAVKVILTTPPSSPSTERIPIPPAGDGGVVMLDSGGFNLVSRDPAWAEVPPFTDFVSLQQGLVSLPHPMVEVLNPDGRPIIVQAAGGPFPSRTIDGREQSVWLHSPSWLMAARQFTGVVATNPPPLTMLEWVVEENDVFVGLFVVPLTFGVPAAVAGFIVLPIARRRARVRWIHLVRLTVLAMHGGLVLGTLALVLGPLAGWLGAEGPVGVPLDAICGVLGLQRDDRELVRTLGEFVGLPFVMGAIWWTWAARHYLRMERPVLVGLSVAAISWPCVVLAVFLVLALLFRQ